MNTLIPTQPSNSVRYWRRRSLWLLPLFILNLTPVWLYFDATHIPFGHLLVIMAAATTFFQMVLLLRTLYVTTTIGRLHRSARNLELIALTGVNAHTFIFALWRGVVRRMWPDYALLAAARLGLALAVAQYLHIGRVNHITFRAWNYISHNGIHNGIQDYAFWNPVWWQFLMAAGVLLIFALVELGLIAALAVGITGTPLKRLPSMLFSLGIIRFSLVVVSLFIIVNTNRIIIQIRTFPDGWCYDVNGDYAPGINRFTNSQCQIMVANHNLMRVLDTATVALSPLMDQGTMLAANLMRPNLSRQYRLDTLDYKPVLFQTDGTTNWGGYLHSRWEISAWRFIGRMGVSVIWCVMIYSVLIAALLRIAQHMAERRGLLSGRE